MILRDTKIGPTVCAQNLYQKFTHISKHVYKNKEMCIRTKECVPQPQLWFLRSALISPSSSCSMNKLATISDNGVWYSFCLFKVLVTYPVGDSHAMFSYFCIFVYAKFLYVYWVSSKWFSFCSEWLCSLAIHFASFCVGHPLTIDLIGHSDLYIFGNPKRLGSM